MDISALTIRPIEADDSERLQRSHLRLSPQSRRARFMSPKPHLSTADARYLSEVDGTGHVALVAVEGDEIVGVVRFVRPPDAPAVAELAIVVADDWQQRGLGSELLGRLARLARGAGVRQLRATMFSDNTAAARLIEGFVAATPGTELRRRQLGIVTEMELALPAAGEREGSSPAMIAGWAGG